MIEILNDLPAFCEDCPHVCLIFKERLGSGKVGFTCKHLHHCSMVYEKGCTSGQQKREYTNEELAEAFCNGRGG